MTISFAMPLLALSLFASTGCSTKTQRSATATHSIMQDIRSSHIDTNTPSEAAFMALLQRDVTAYLVANRLPAKQVKIELLRKEATQSGVSYPKYYAWVRADDGAENRIEGAMRIVAIEQDHFEISDFTLAATVRSDPESLTSIYPAMLIPAIRRHADAN